MVIVCSTTMSNRDLVACFPSKDLHETLVLSHLQKLLRKDEYLGSMQMLTEDIANNTYGTKYFASYPVYKNDSDGDSYDPLYYFELAEVKEWEK